MTNKQIDRLMSTISSLQGTQIIEIRAMIEAELKRVERREENFFMHDYPDGYAYYVKYNDGSYHIYCKGKQAYNEFIKSEDALLIYRTDNAELFPVKEIIMEKENEQKGLRH